MKKFQVILMLVLTVFVLSGCLYPEENKVENQVPDVDQLTSVQRAVDDFRKDTGGLVPIKNREEDTDIFIKYLVDFEKIVPKYISKAPANSYEKGGLFQYIIWDPENTAEVKLVDLRGPEKIRDINMRKIGTQYVAIDKAIAQNVYSINYERMGFDEPLTVPSPYSDTQLPIVMTGDGELYIDYSIELNRVLQEKKPDVKSGEDIRHILYDNSPIVPAYSLPYTVDENNEPVFMVDKNDDKTKSATDTKDTKK